MADKPLRAESPWLGGRRGPQKQYTGPEWDVHRIQRKARGFLFTLNVGATKSATAPVIVMNPHAQPDALACLSCKVNECKHTRFVAGYLRRKGGAEHANKYLNDIAAWLALTAPGDDVPF